MTNNVRKGIKMAAWTFGMMFAGMILGAKSSYALTWYGGLIGSPAAILIGAGIGFVLGFIFTLK
jgi:putative flippase GtrA